MPDRSHPAGYGRSAHEQPVYDRSPPRRSRSLLVLLPVLAFFAGFGSIVWLAYVDSTATSMSGEPPLIRADTRPIKLPPDDPGGRVVADQGELRDLFSEEPEPVTERLLPLPEEPMTPPSAETLAQQADDLARETAASAGTGAPARTAVPPAAAATAEASPASPEASDQTEPVAAEEEEEGIGGPPATAAAIASLLEETGAGRAEPEARAATAAARPADQDSGSSAPDAAAPAPAVAERAAERPAPRSQAPEPEPAPEPEQQTLLARAPNPATASARPAAGSLDEPHYRIQLAAVRNEADARRAWELFKLDLSELLAGVEPIIERGETGNGVFYRVQLGPYADAGQAEDLCEEFKQRNASCFVLRR